MVEPMVVSILVALVLGAISVWVLNSFASRNRTTKSGCRLPKGSMGWPLVGETLVLMADPIAFAEARIKKYGSIFKTSFVFMNCIVSTTADFTRFVLTNPSLFKGRYLKSLVLLAGESFIFRDGQKHSSMKKLLSKPLSAEGLRHQVGKLDALMIEELNSWAEKGLVVSAEETKKLSLTIALHVIIGLENVSGTAEGKWLQQQYAIMGKAFFAPPVNIPGTTFHKGMKAKATLDEYMKKLLDEKKNESYSQDHVMGAMLAARADPQVRGEVQMEELDDKKVVSNLVAFLAGAYDTTATSLLWVIKILADNPDVLRAVAAEQEEILKSKDPTEPRLTWEDTRKMVYASKVINELLRRVPISFLVTREATTDVEYNGILIPKGWSVQMLMGSIHLDPKLFPDPLKFDPSRFQTTPKPFTYLPWGSGPHMCPGGEMAKLIMLIFIHHLSTKFQWETTSSDTRMIWYGLPHPKGGYPIKIWRK